MEENLEFLHVINDPIHGIMEFKQKEKKLIKPFIDHPSFQRLRYIKQMGMGDLVFPGAVHTRFNHSIGCCYVSKKIAERLNLSLQQKELALLAGLLHDIGHGPFSHAFEKIFKVKITHEDWTGYFIDEFTNSKECKLSKENALCLKKIISPSEANSRESDKSLALLEDIVSSQLDADRLDYLLRDSHFCGVSYGQYDLNWLINSMIEIRSGKENRLAINAKGIGVTEHYLMARRLMTRNIYHHPKKNAAEYLLRKFIEEISIDIEKNEYLNKKIVNKNFWNFLFNLNKLNKKYNTVLDHSTYQKLKHDFLKENFSLYKEFCDYDILYLIRELALSKEKYSYVEIAKRFRMRKLPKALKINMSRLETTKTIIEEIKKKEEGKIEEWQINLDTDLGITTYKNEEKPIFIKDKIPSIQNLTYNSRLIETIADQKEKIYLLYIDEEIFENNCITELKTTLHLNQCLAEELTSLNLEKYKN